MHISCKEHSCHHLSTRGTAPKACHRCPWVVELEFVVATLEVVVADSSCCRTLSIVHCRAAPIFVVVNTAAVAAAAPSFDSIQASPRLMKSTFEEIVAGSRGHHCRVAAASVQL